MEVHIGIMELSKYVFEEEPLTGLVWWGPFLGTLITLIPIILIVSILIRWRRKRKTTQLDFIRAHAS